MHFSAKMILILNSAAGTSVYLAFRYTIVVGPRSGEFFSFSDATIVPEASGTDGFVASPRADVVVVYVVYPSSVKEVISSGPHGLSEKYSMIVLTSKVCSFRVFSLSITMTISDSDHYTISLIAPVVGLLPLMKVRLHFNFMLILKLWESDSTVLA